MDRMKAISVRFTEEEIKSLDLLQTHHPYYTRSTVVRAAVAFMLTRLSPEEQNILLCDYGQNFEKPRLAVTKLTI